MNQNELLGLRLLSLHNLRFVLALTRGAREAIERGTFAAYKRDRLERLPRERIPDPHRDSRRGLGAVRRSRRAAGGASHPSMQDSLDVGDEVITAGGLHATVKELGESELQLEIAPGVVVTLDRRAVAAVAREVGGRGRTERARRNAPIGLTRPTRTPLTCARLSSRRSHLT